MASLVDLPELVGFFSYSREDDADSLGALSALRIRIQGELRGQLGRTAKTFRLWQDKEAIPSGTLWETEIKNAVGQAVFFIPIITPTVIASPYCRFELEAFLARETALNRDDLVFPILYIDVRALEDAARRRDDPVISLIAARQYVDWRPLRHMDVRTTDVSVAVERFCRHIRDALSKSWISPQEREQQEEAARRQRAEEDRTRHEAEVKLREDEARRRAGREQADSEFRRRQQEDLRRAEEGAERSRTADAEMKRRAADERRLERYNAEREQAEAGQQKAQVQSGNGAATFVLSGRRVVLVIALIVGVALFSAAGGWMFRETPTLMPIAHESASPVVESLACVPASIQGLFLRADFPGVTTSPGTKSIVSLSLQNYDMDNEQFDLSLRGIATGWTVAFAPGQPRVPAVNVPKNSSVRLPLQLAIPVDAPVGPSKFTVIASSYSATLELPIAVEVARDRTTVPKATPATPTDADRAALPTIPCGKATESDHGQSGPKGFYLSSNALSVKVRPGGTYSLSVHLINIEMVPENLALSLSGLPKDWIGTLVGEGQFVFKAMPAANSSLDFEILLEVPKNTPSAIVTLTLEALGVSTNLSLPFTVAIAN